MFFTDLKHSIPITRLFPKTGETIFPKTFYFIDFFLGKGIEFLPQNQIF